MAEDSTIILNSDDQSLGKIQIAPRVIEIIAGIAANEIDGVSKMHGSLANNVGELLGRSDRRRGLSCSTRTTKPWPLTSTFTSIMVPNYRKWRLKSRIRLPNKWP